MKTIFLFLFLFFVGNPSVTEIRKLYATAPTSESVAKDLSSKLADVSKEDNKVLLAYKGASIIILSKLEKKVSDKSKKFKEGVSLVEYAVEKDPNSIEIRMIRLSIQENVPKIVNYKANKKEDKQFLLDHYKEQSVSLKTYIGTFISQSNSFTATEKKLIE